MPAVNVTDWRKIHSADFFVYISRPATVLDCRVNLVTAVYPILTLPFDGVISGSYTNVKDGYTVLVGSTQGAWDYGIVRVRGTATSTTIPISRSSRGELVGEVRAVDNAYIRVLKERRLWAKIPRIDGTSIYKDEALYADSIALAPVVVFGSDFAGRVDATTGLLTVVFTDDSFTRAGATITGRLFNLDGGTVTAGSLTGSTVTATFPSGEYDCSLRITDSNGYISTGYCFIAAVARTIGDTYASIPVEIGSITRRPEGVEAEITVKGAALPQTVYYPGTRCIIFAEEYYNGVLGSINNAARGAVKFSGWLQTETSEIEAAQTGKLARVNIKLADIVKRLTQVPKFSDILHRKATATTWNHIDEAEANLNGAIIQYLRTNTTALELADFKRAAGGGSYEFSLLSGPKGNAYESVDFMARAMRHRLTCNSRGRLEIRGYPNYLPTAGQGVTFPSLPVLRTAVEIATLNGSDWHTLQHIDGQPPNVHWINGSAIQISTQDGEDEDREDTPLFAIAPGTTPGQGATAHDAGQQLVVNQDELNCVEGHRYKTNNAKRGLISGQLTRGGDAGFEPADMEWVVLNLTAAEAAQRGITFTNARCLVVEQRFEFVGNGVVHQFLTLEPEQVGQRAETVIREENPSNLPTIPNPTTVLPTIPAITNTFGLKGIGNMILAAVGFGFDLLIETNDFGTLESNGGPTWTQHDESTALDGTLLDASVDAFSPLYIGTGTTVNIWVATTTRCYYIEDIFGAITVTSKHTFAASSSNRVIQSERGFPNHVCVATYYGGGNGTKLLHSTDNTTFTETSINTNTLTANTGTIPSLHVSGHIAGQVYVTAANASGKWYLYRCNITGGAPTFTDITPAAIVSTDYVPYLYVPFNASSDDSVFYFTRSLTGSFGVFLYKHTPAGDTDLSPDFGGATSTTIAPVSSFHRRSMGVCDNDLNTILIVGVRDTASDPRSVCLSRDGGLTWAQIVTEADTVTEGYQGCAMSADRDVGYLFGASGRVVVVRFSGLTAAFDDRLGNLSTGATVLNLMGG